MNGVDADALTAAVVVEAMFVCLAVSLLIGRGLFLSWRLPRDDRRLADAVRLLARTIEGRTDGPRSFERAVEHLPARLRLRLLTDVAPNVSGRHRILTARAVADSGLAARANAWCSGRSWRRRVKGLRMLALLKADSAVAPRLLRDADPRVRAQAVRWAGTQPSPEVLELLLDMLGEPDNRSPFLVKDALVRIGRPVVEPLTRIISQGRGTRRRAALEVAVVLADPGMSAAALDASHDDDAVNRALTARLLGALGGSDTASRLLEMLEDPDSTVRGSAAEALGSMAYWPAVAPVASLLRDEAWIVRSNAALALAAMGAPGLLLLRRALGDEDSFARDAARRVLNVPSHPGTRPAG